jgi:hypothetical protein
MKSVIDGVSARRGHGHRPAGGHRAGKLHGSGTSGDVSRRTVDGVQVESAGTLPPDPDPVLYGPFLGGVTATLGLGGMPVGQLPLDRTAVLTTSRARPASDCTVATAP